MAKEIIQKGLWLYDGAIEAQVVIEKRDFAAGTGDYEDEFEVREDRFGEFYFLINYSLNDPRRILSEIGPFDSIDDAKYHMDSALEIEVCWQ